jgi:serine/threonine protein kinase
MRYIIQILHLSHFIGTSLAASIIWIVEFMPVASFDSQVDVLSRAQHKNLVSLIGYCSESKNLMLIYEHMSGGSLWDSLHGEYIVEQDVWLSCCILILIT